MRRQPGRISVFALAAALLGALLVPMYPGLAAAGDVDLEVTVVGTPRARVLSLGPFVEWTVTVTNSTQDEAITSTATGVTVKDVQPPSSPSPTAPRANAMVTTGSYDSVTGTWSIPSLAPGASATLTYRTEFSVLATNASPTVIAEVTAQAQPDRDSKPAEDTDVGDEDDEGVYTATTTANRKIGDQVWNDLNGDGRFAPGEPGVRGVPVIVTNAAGFRLFAVRTDAAGLWAVPITEATAISVRFVAPPGATFTTPKVGDDTADSDADASGQTATRTISVDDLRIDAGLRIQADLSVTKRLTTASGVVPFVATYAVSVVNAGPGPAAGVEVTDRLPTGAELVAGSLSVTQGTTVTTTSAITWTVGSVAAGSTVTLRYQLRYAAVGTFSNVAQVTAATTPDPDSSPTTASTSCSAQPGQDDCSTAVATATPRTGTVTGTVWRDTNGNGQREAGEPGQAGVTVRLRLPDQAGTVVATTTTADNGTWSSPAVAAGTYVVEVVAPAGARFTVANQGSDASDSDVDAGGRASVDVVGGATAAVDAGLLRADSPTADRISAAQGVPVTLNVLDNDGVPGRGVGATLPTGWTWTRVDGPAWGSVTCQPNGSCTYHAVSNYAGPDGFRYTLTNPLYGAATVDVTITVSPVNDPPVARDDRAVTGPGRPVTVPVTANDTDPNDPFVAGDVNRPGDPPTVAGVGAVMPAGAGAATCDGRSCTFSPATGFTGVARFTYTLVDKGIPPQSGQAVVEVWVDPDQPALTGFSGDESADVTASTAAWAPTTQVVASGLCADGRPRVAVTWQPVERATGYRVERRAGDASADAWVEVAVVAGGATAWSDERVGEGRTFGYRVTPLRHRWAGQPSAAAGVTTPAPSGPTGC